MPNLTNATLAAPTMQLSQRHQHGWIKLSIIIALIAAAIGGTIYMRQQKNAGKENKESKDGKDDKPQTIEFSATDVTTLKAIEIGQSTPVSGTIKPLLQATVKSKVSAQIAQVHAQEGERVSANQVLVTLDGADLRARYDAQNAAVAEAKARFDLAKKNVENNRSLLAKGFISQSAFDNVQSTVDVAQASLQAAQSQTTIAQRALADAQVRAPFAGIVAQRMVNLGEKISSDQPLMQIVELSKMEMEAQIPVNEISYVKIGQEITLTVDGFGSRTFSGKVERINPSTEAGSRAISIYLTLANQDSALRGGMFAVGSLRTQGRPPVLALPSSAVIEAGGQSYAFEIINGKLDRKPIKTGISNPDSGMTEIKEGLTAGAQVVAVKPDGLKHGATAIMKTGTAAAPAVAATPKPAAPAIIGTAEAATLKK